MIAQSAFGRKVAVGESGLDTDLRGATRISRKEKDLLPNETKKGEKVEWEEVFQ